ncbi:MAG: adenosylcobalamin-dependent ribonucleoside-diphosphate reductase [Candidatus Levybacteria bacterium]|nr:adenosylcobalamin-dependent ribonucleoside-diphosphate reductase [Candidatus Levybacteria bacterium]
MKLDGVRQKVFLDRYSLKDKEGKPLEKTPDEMWRRVAKGIAGQEKKSLQKIWEKKFYDAISGFKFLPGGRILAGAGTGFDVTYFNCFVIPSPKDSRDGILDNLKIMIEIMARGGGVGINLSSLRPKGARVKKVNGFSSGPMNWAELYSLATKDIIQQGGSRRGALMLMLHDWHPDIEEFITVKEDLRRINGANLSVCVSDDFMEAVKNDSDWKLEFPDLDDPKYDKKWDGDLKAWKARGGRVVVKKTVKAKYLWDLICSAAWRSAEPGLHFLDRSNKRSNTYYFEQLIATNPCGEQPLGEWAVCNLGAINLSAYVHGGEFDYKNFGKDVRTAIRFLDNVIDDTYYFYPENEKIAKDIRRTGLGILGLADALIKMKLRYGAAETEETLRKIFETLRDNAYDASADIAKEKGAFPKFKAAKYLKGYHIQALPQKIKDKIARNGIRNAVLLTIAPTGTTSLISGVSSGVEPVYEFEFIRRDRLGEHKMYHPLFEAWKKNHPNDVKPDYFVSANDLTPEEHVMVQSIAQEYIDSSISKTVNAPNAHTPEDVKNLYMLAYEHGLKGITYMREGSREGVLSRVNDKKDQTLGRQESAPATLPKEYVRAPRPMMVEGVTYKTQTPVGDTFITLNHDQGGEPFEVFITIGKTGSDLSAMADALGRMISLNLRLAGNLPPRERIRQVISQLSGIGGARSVGFGENRVRSLPDAVAKILAKQYAFRVNGAVEDKLAPGVLTPVATPAADLPSEKEEITVLQQLPLQEGIVGSKADTHLFDICPECGAGAFAYEEGCRKCYSCGHSEC